MYVKTNGGIGAYRRRRGLGAEAMGPPVDPNAPVQAPDVQQQIADIWDTIFQSQAGAPVVQVGAGPPSFTQTLNANAGKIALGAGAFLLVILFAKAGR